MINPIPRSSLFGTPASVEALDQYIRSMSPREQQTAYLISMLTINLCYKLVEEEKAKELTT